MRRLDEPGSGLPGPLDEAARNYAPILEEIDADLAKEFPDIGQRSEILKITRQALSEGGFDRVREPVRQGVLPVAVQAVGSGAISRQSRQQRDGNAGV